LAKEFKLKFKGIILAGGDGTRLHPITKVINKQLLPVYDKPMIYYPLSILMLAGIREILIISTPHDLSKFKQLFGDGSHLGLQIFYEIQPQPKGLAQAFVIGKDFIGDKNVCLILGDNIFYSHGLPNHLENAIHLEKGGLIFGYWVKNPEHFGVVEFDQNYRVKRIAEKPKRPKSNYAIPGLYFFDNDVVSIASELEPSDRGELEIIDVIKAYLKKGDLQVILLGRGFAWLDTGTPESLSDASNFIETIQKRQGLKIACIEEIAYRKGYIDGNQLYRLAETHVRNDYGQYLYHVLEGR
jgi:glucose-1-phosphate thymidylyltransferase